MVEKDRLYYAYFEEREGGSGNTRIGPPSSADWDKACRLVKFLKIFYGSTLIFSATSSVTSSTCYPEIVKIEATLNLLMAGTDLGLRTMAYEMKKKFDKYWGEAEKMSRLLHVASVLDPRDKLCFISHCFDKLHEKDTTRTAELKKEVEMVLRRLFEWYKESYGKQMGISTSQGDNDGGSGMQASMALDSLLVDNAIDDDTTVDICSE